MMTARKSLFAALFLSVLAFPCGLASAPAEDEDLKGTRTAPTLDALTPEILEKSRAEHYASRVKPEDYDFDSMERKLKTYTSSVRDEKNQKRELRRLKYIKGVRENLIHTFERNAYSGSIKLRSGSTSGVISMANENGFVVKSKGGKKGKERKWEQMHPLQMALLVEYYGEQRLRGKAGKVGNDDRRTDAAINFLVGAIFADWYGEYDTAVRLIKKAVKTNPSLEKLAEALFLD